MTMDSDRKTYVVYNSETGDVVYQYHSSVAPGGASPSDAELEAAAIELGSLTGKHSGGGFAALSVDAAALKRGLRYSVDLSSKQLRSTPL
jgi:hypothetical protein